jgi:two-component system cell cycle response regulator
MTARILIVDDVPANARLLEARLAADYYQVASAHDGSQALARAAEWQPDLILLDVMMPGMDGYECCRRLKAEERTQHIPVVMVTSLGEPGERLRGLETGADDFLTKPIEFDTLMVRVRSLIRLKRLLDEWRVRGETARALGLGSGREPEPLAIGASALVIDDVDQAAATVQAALRRESILSQRAASAPAALALAQSAQFDLIVLGLSMAAGDPLQLVASLRASDRTHETPLLLIAEPEQRARALRAIDIGANDWLTAPVDENELRVRARNQIRRKFYQDRLRADLGLALEMALTDPLTGLYNQRYLMRHLRSQLDSGQPGPIALLMIDVDHFKLVNDDHGHSVGDRALQAVAAVLRANTRAIDTIARYGGEEFVVVMPATDREQAAEAGERLRAAVEALDFEPARGRRCHLTVSIGTACTRPGPSTPEAVLTIADRALYDAKRAGRNTVAHALVA